MKAPDIQERLLVIVCTSVCVVVAALAWFVSGSELTVPLAILSLAPPLGVGLSRARRHGIVDPLAVFAFCFASYNGVLLLTMSYGVDPHQTPFATNGSTYFRAGILSGLGSLGLVAGWLLSTDRRSEPVIQGSQTQCTAAFLTGTAFYLIGMALYMVQYSQIGGYMHAVSMDRGQRFQMLTQAVSMPYEGFVLSGLGLMVYASVGVSKLRLTLSSVACLIWLALVLLQGDRRLALQMIMAVAVVIGTLRPSRVKLRPAALLFIALGYSLAVLFGQYRGLIYDLAAGRSTLKQAQVAADAEDSIMGKTDQSELVGPYISVLYYSSGAEPLRWGSSYVMSIPAVVPKVLYPGAKTPAISVDLSQTLYEGIGPVYGWGFSPVAEGFANFGLVGAFGVMVVWSLFFAWLGLSRYRGVAGMLVCATLLQEAVNANRIDFRYVYFESVYCASVAIVAVMIMKAVTEIAERSRGPVRANFCRTNFVAARRSSAL